MSNMTETQRNQMDTTRMAGTNERIRRGSETGVRVYNVVAALLAIVGCVAAVSFLDDWAQWVVLGGIIFTTIGFIIAVSPNRQA